MQKANKSSELHMVLDTSVKKSTGTTNEDSAF